jgi:hypothetical protein
MPTGREPAPAPGRREVLFHVEEHGARDVPGAVRVSAAPRRVEVPAHVDHAQIPLSSSPWLARRYERELGGQPFGRDERVHVGYFIFVTGCGTFL